jgi:quercetin dioxygenase-like cupin family protein
MSLVEDASAAEIVAVLGRVGARLKRLRTLRRMTLVEVARIWLKPDRLKGRIAIPLTRQPDGAQAWKIVIPAGNATPQPRAHDGHEWIYVLSGRMRLVLGDQDWVLVSGEIAEFSTRIPHWFGSTGNEPAEILSIFNRPGERMTIRTTTPQP